MKGIKDDDKTKEKLREEFLCTQKKEEENKKYRKLDNIVCLKDINLKIKKGSFVCIIGKVGSGKSSLLSAMIGDLLQVPDEIVKSYMGCYGIEKELDQKETEAFQSDLVDYNRRNMGSRAIEIDGTVAYTQQTPWIRNKIVRDNITYTMPFDVDKYVQTVQHCELEKDFETLKAGD